MTEFCEKVTASINKQQSTIMDSPTSTHTKLAEAIKTTSPLILKKLGRNEPGWFQEASNILEPLIKRRNTVFIEQTSNPSRQFLIRTLITTRREINKAVALVKEKWILSLCDHLNRGCIEKGGTSGIWTLINRINAGFSKVQKSNQTQMKKPDGTKCMSPAENAEVFRNHFAQLYEKKPTNSDSIDTQLNQLPIRPEMDGLTTEKEINLAIQQLNNSAAGASGIRAEIY